MTRPNLDPMNTPKVKARLTAIITAALVAISGSLIAAPSASAAKADLVWYIDRDFREELDIKGDGMSAGDITVANGQISEVRGGKSVGTYSMVGIDASVNIPGGRINRSVTLALTVDASTIYTMSMVATNGGVPPTKKNVYAIVGGTGKYSGVRGEMALRPLSDTRYKVSFYFVD